MNNFSDRIVVVLGASDNPDRYSYRAVRELLSQGFKTIPVNPHLNKLLDLPVLSSLKDIKMAVDTLTVYVSPKHSSALKDEILELRPQRVIFNPGAENAELEQALDMSGIPYLHACSLVLLSTGRF